MFEPVEYYSLDKATQKLVNSAVDKAIKVIGFTKAFELLSENKLSDLKSTILSCSNDVPNQHKDVVVNYFNNYIKYLDSRN